MPSWQLTLTMASLVCAMSEMTPSVMMSSTEYWEPSCTAAAFLGWAAWARISLGGPSGPVHAQPQPSTLKDPARGRGTWLHG